MNRTWIVRALGDRAAFERLARGMRSSELWSLLLEVLRERSRARTPAEVLAQYRRDAFVRPSPIDQRVMRELDRQLLLACEDFEALELSPVAPLGTCSTMAPTDPNRTLAALRGTEVVSDPTNVLALECAERLGRAPHQSVRLATVQRVIRAQQVPAVPGFSQHFGIFVLASAGRETKDHGFTAGALREHVEVMMRALDRLERHGYAFGERRLQLLSTPERAAVRDRLAASFSGLAVECKELTHRYYDGGLRYTLWVDGQSAGATPLVDGGVFGWVARLRSNRRLSFVASGMGAQLAAFAFRRQRAAVLG